MGQISGAGSGIVKGGTGSLLMAANNSYTGTTTVNAGEVILEDADISESAVTLEGGALVGVGTCGAVTANGGTISPGSSPGKISVVGNLSLGAGSTLEVEIDGRTLGTEYDQLDVSGGVDIGGATLDLAFGFTPEAGDEFVIISNDGTDAVTGAFDGLPQGSSVEAGGVPAVIDYTGGDGNDVTIAVVTLNIDDIEVTQSIPLVDQTATFTVALSVPTMEEVSVDYATVDGTATSPLDYTSQSGTLDFGVLEVSKTIDVEVKGDVVIESAKTFSIELSNPLNALTGNDEGVCTINSMDPADGGCGCVIGGDSRWESITPFGVVMTLVSIALLLSLRRRYASRQQDIARRSSL